MKILFKLSIVFFTILCFHISHLNAQIGLKGGLVLSNLEFQVTSIGNFDLDSESVIGYQIGVVYNVGVGNKLAIQPEIAFNYTGNRLVVDPVDMSPDNQVSTTYGGIELAALAHYNLIGTNDGIRLYFLGGILGEYFLNEVTVFGLENSTTEIRQDLSNSEFLDRLNYSLTYGLGLGLNSFYFQVRRTVGLSGLNPITLTDANGQSIGQSTFKSRDFRLVAGYLF